MSESILSELVGELGWKLAGTDCGWRGVAIDNRVIEPGELFVALRGDRHDGHDYVLDALSRGAAGAVVSRPVAGARTQLLVDDTQVALGQLAARHRRAWNGRMFAVTGSAGKTSTKEMLAAILARSASVRATRGNLNNEIGVPLTLLGLEPSDQCAVLELGAAKPGDIAYLVDLVRPRVSILTNAMPAHLEGFGSVDQVARTKGEIFVPERGCIAVVNSDDRYAADWRQRAGAARVVDFSMREESGAAVRAAALDLAAEGAGFRLCGEFGSCDIRLQVPGAHNVANALAAAAAALAVGVPLAQVQCALEQFGGVPGRMQVRTGRKGLKIIDDTYNANPQAVRSALDVLAAHEGVRALILGDMAELGGDSESLHREVGAYARDLGIEGLIAVGPQAAFAAEAFGSGARRFRDKSQLDDWLAETDLAGEYGVCLVKGSRSAGMEQVVKSLSVSSVRGVPQAAGISAQAARRAH